VGFRKTGIGSVHIQTPGVSYGAALSAAREYLNDAREGRRRALGISMHRDKAHMIFSQWRDVIGRSGDLSRSDRRHIRRVESILNKAQRIERKSRAQENSDS